MASTTQHDWRPEVEKAYGGPIPDLTWDHLIDKRYIAQLDDDPQSMPEVIDHLREMNQYAPALAWSMDRRVSKGDDAQRLAGINTRMRAVAEVVAARAGRTMAVQRFRRSYLPHGLIDADQVNAWVSDMYQATLPANWPKDMGPGNATNFAVVPKPIPRPIVSLEWLDHGEKTVKVWPVHPSRPLGKLVKLSEKLAERWEWHPAYATDFILTGDTPPRPGVRGITFRPTSGRDDRYGKYEMMSIHCMIDAEVTPEELAIWWRGVRTEIGVAGRRPIGEKSIALAKFALLRDEIDDESVSFRQAMEIWNSEVGAEWQFTDHRNFRTAAIKAIRSLNCPVDPRFNL